jgi:TolA-binding protein
MERGAALHAIVTDLEALSHDDVAAENRAAARLLAGEIAYEVGDGEQARDHFRRAEKAGRDGPFADDAAFVAIRALELDGRDREAAREWNEWLDDHDDSPLLPEALLAGTWNAIRRDSLAAATGLLDQLMESAPWMREDDRVLLAGATVAFLDGRSSAALALLGDHVPGPEASYLKGLCHEQLGEMLPAAASFQEVAQGHFESALADPAMLAKADIFLKSRAYRNAAEEFARVAELARRTDIRAEAQLRAAASQYFDGDVESSVASFREVVSAWPATSVAARAQFLLAEVYFSQGLHDEAIPEFNRVLSNHFEHDVAARAQYRVGRALDALGRSREATSAYQAVVAGYSQAPEAPAAAYLAGVGLVEQDMPLAAAPYFQLVLDRYAQEGRDGTFAFATPAHQELVEASLCLLELSFYRAGDLAQLSGVPHLMLGKMPASGSTWRAHALLIDADALASQSRYEEAQGILDALITEFPRHDVAVPANRLLAWTHSRLGNDALAIEIEERMLDQYAAAGDESLASALLNRAHIRFNEKSYEDAAAAYDDYVVRFPEEPKALLALYQAGLSHQRLGREGDAVDRWERLVSLDPGAEIAEKAWARAGDVYFRAEHYDDAKRCFGGLLEHFSGSAVAARGALHIAQCEYNAGRDREALERYSDVVTRYPNTRYAQEAEQGLQAALYRLGQSADGAEVLAQLIERFPNSPFAAEAQFEIAMRAYQAEEYESAAEEFRRVVTQFTSYAAVDRAQHLMADCYLRTGDDARAREAYEQFLFFFPSSALRPVAQFQLGSLRFQQGDYLQAAVDFTATLDEEISGETRRAALYNLGLCQILLEQSEAATVTLERFRAVQTPGDPRAADVAYRLADLHERHSRWEEALGEYEVALASASTEALTVELHYRIGSCHEQLSREDDAIRFYRKAAMSDDHSDAYHISAAVRLAALYEKRGEPLRALAAYRDVLRNSTDQALVAAVEQRVTHLKSLSR